MPGYLKDGQAGLYLSAGGLHRPVSQCWSNLALFERHAIGALFLLRICLVGTDCDGIQRAQVLRLFVMLALVYSAADCLITTLHSRSSFEFQFQ